VAWFVRSAPAFAEAPARSRHSARFQRAEADGALRLLAPLYARGAAWRRAWYGRHAEARRRLARPVISVGNLAVGGSGKTPVVAAIARWLVSAGDRPSILSRGYARPRADDGILVVSDCERVLEPVARSGDEPQMLARALPGVPVLVGADRFTAGRIAERRFGCTVHLLDDGFQHFALHRDVDLLLVSRDDLDDAVLPAGRLREPLEAAAGADALLVTGDDADVRTVSARLRVERSFHVVPSFGAPRLLAPFGALMPRMAGMRTLAVAGIARPRRFFDAVRAQGWEVMKELAFRDHHWFTESDLKRMLATARALGADLILTTEKDAMRLLNLPLAPIPRTFAYLPMTVTIEPAAEFTAWLGERLKEHRPAG
jgi:tetraacyldisaccharide 4'-kinase